MQKIEYEESMPFGVATIGGVTTNHVLETNEFGSQQFKYPPCAIVQTGPDVQPVIARLTVCRNYKAKPSIGAIVNGELCRDVLGVRWTTAEDFA